MHVFISLLLKKKKNLTYTEEDFLIPGIHLGKQAQRVE